MRSPLFSVGAIVLAAAGVVTLDACHHKPVVPPPAPIPLSDSAMSALTWINAHAVPFTPDDSGPASAREREVLTSLAAGAKVIGFSEMVEGTHELPYIMRRTLLTLADAGVRGIALQASMADAMEVDRYVRGGTGDPRRLLRALNPEGSQRIGTRQMESMVEALRTWNKANPQKQIGFYGFEIPTAVHAVQSITMLPDSILGKTLKAWLTQKYSCVQMNEAAHWGLEGRPEDSTFWTACGPATTQALDSVTALRKRETRYASQLSFAEQMARLIQHHVKVGLSRPARHDGNAEHVLFLLDLLGPDAKLVLWGGDVEAGRLTLDNTLPQTGLALGKKLGSGYRAIAFTVGDGTIRARQPQRARGGGGGGRGGGGEPDISDATITPPDTGTYESLFMRAAPAGAWLDLRTLPTDAAGKWLAGPRPIRLISETWFPIATTQFETSIKVPDYYDAIVYVKHATPAKAL